MKLKIAMIIEADINDISKVIQTLSEEVDIYSISVEPLEEKEGE